MAQTDFSNICHILGQLYYQHKEDTDFSDFIEYNDIGLPLAFLSSEGLCEPTEDGRRYIVETFSIFLGSLNIEDQGFTSLEEIFNFASKKDGLTD
jgi:hypothetical protein